MTVHTEFAPMALIMPDTLPPISLRELHDTAVTRAKKTFTLRSATR
ncbi:hypothetical protein [Vreelandella salicampi]|uniref:Uncharacterized protein n=1 Tax=Vreelandella salicampi TaxID=1449798 RepID=A0A7Z0LI33_9GAMM|nr:hypothetical protein [Halomonas salicampi]NYS59327.1 hypothetical protein [Halomonas salicampi]